MSSCFPSLLVALMLTGAALSPLPLSAEQSGQVGPVDQGGSIISVEGLEADYHTSSKAIYISARIKNVSRTFLRGYATIYLLSAEGQELYSFQEEVNRGEVFAHGATVDFEASALVMDISRVSSISVDFTRY